MGGGGFSGRVRALNLTVPLGSGRVGSDDLGYGPGTGFSFEPVQTSRQGLFFLLHLHLYSKRRTLRSDVFGNRNRKRQTL